jgi:hypothetical protein
MTAFTSPVTQACPALTSPGGCSLTLLFGITQETAGSVPCFAAEKK